MVDGFYGSLAISFLPPDCYKQKVQKVIQLPWQFSVKEALQNPEGPNQNQELLQKQSSYFWTTPSCSEKLMSQI